MFNSEALKAFLRWGVLIFVGSIALLFFQTPGSASFYATIFSLCIGAILIALVAVVIRLQ